MFEHIVGHLPIVFGPRQISPGLWGGQKCDKISVKLNLPQLCLAMSHMVHILGKVLYGQTEIFHKYT